MGLCASKIESQRPKPTIMRVRTKNDSRKPSSNRQPKQESRNTINNNTNANKNNVPVSGRRLADDAVTPKRPIPAREAARKATEERVHRQQEKYGRGELGRKLAKERAKSNTSRLRESMLRMQKNSNKKTNFPLGMDMMMGQPPGMGS